MRKSGFIPMLEDMPRDKVKIIIAKDNKKPEEEKKDKAKTALKSTSVSAVFQQVPQPMPSSPLLSQCPSNFSSVNGNSDFEITRVGS